MEKSPLGSSLGSIYAMITANIRGEASVKSCCPAPVESKPPIEVDKRLSFTGARDRNVKLKISKTAKIFLSRLSSLES